MKYKTGTRFLYWEHILKIVSALYIIISSVYDIKEDITHIRKEHGLFVIGIYMLIKSVIELRKTTKQLSDTIKTMDLPKEGVV